MATFEINRFEINRAGHTWFLSSDPISAYIHFTERQWKILFALEGLPDQARGFMDNDRAILEFSQVKLKLHRDKDGSVSVLSITRNNEVNEPNPVYAGHLHFNKIEELQAELEEVRNAKRNCIERQQFEHAARLRDRELELLLTIKDMEAGAILAESQLAADNLEENVSPIMPGSPEWKESSEVESELMAARKNKQEATQMQRYEDAAAHRAKEKRLMLLLKRLEAGRKLMRGQDEEG